MDEQTRYEQLLSLIAGVFQLAERDAIRGNEEARDFLRELRGDFAPTSIPLRRHHGNATQRWAIDETATAQRMRRSRMTV